MCRSKIATEFWTTVRCPIELKCSMLLRPHNKNLIYKYFLKLTLSCIRWTPCWAPLFLIYYSDWFGLGIFRLWNTHSDCTIENNSQQLQPTYIYIILFLFSQTSSHTCCQTIKNVGWIGYKCFWMWHCLRSSILHGSILLM